MRVSGSVLNIFATFVIWGWVGGCGEKLKFFVSWKLSLIVAGPLGKAKSLPFTMVHIYTSPCIIVSLPYWVCTPSQSPMIVGVDLFLENAWDCRIVYAGFSIFTSVENNCGFWLCREGRIAYALLLNFQRWLIFRECLRLSYRACRVIHFYLGKVENTCGFWLFRDCHIAYALLFNFRWSSVWLIFREFPLNDYVGLIISRKTKMSEVS